jgi:type VI protein secretion system component VasK
MNLSNPDARRGLRSFIMAIAVLALLYFIWEWAERLDPEALRETVRGCLILIGIAMVGYQMENVTRAFKVSAPGGISLEAGAEAAAGAQLATDAAQEVVEELKP